MTVDIILAREIKNSQGRIWEHDEKHFSNTRSRQVFRVSRQNAFYNPILQQNWYRDGSFQVNRSLLSLFCKSLFYHFQPLCTLSG